MEKHPLLLQAIGNTLERFRNKKKMTKTALAGLSALEECYVRGIVQGRRNPTADALYSLCTTLGISLSVFFAAVDKEMSEKTSSSIKA